MHTDETIEALAADLADLTDRQERIAWERDSLAAEARRVAAEREALQLRIAALGGAPQRYEAVAS